MLKRATAKMCRAKQKTKSNAHRKNVNVVQEDESLGESSNEEFQLYVKFISEDGNDGEEDVFVGETIIAKLDKIDDFH